MTKPDVSILTTTYNLEAYIGHAVESVISQTFGSWEMIIIDDCSIDRTVNIVKEYMKKDNRIKLIQHKTNWGIERAKESYNEGLKISQGKYIAFLDGDDFWPNNKLEIQIKSFKDPDVVLSFGNCIFTDSNGKPFHIVDYRKERSYLLNNPPGCILHLFADLNFYIVPVTVVIKKEALIKIGGFRKDHDFFFIDVPTFLALSLEGPFSFQRRITGYYRKHSKSYWFNLSKETTSMGREELQKCYIRFIGRNRNRILSNGIFLNVNEIEKEQDAYIKLKKIRKPLSLVLHYLLFNDKELICKKIRDLMDRKGGGFQLNDIFSFFLFLLSPIRNLLLRIIFIKEYLQYRLS